MIDDLKIRELLSLEADRAPDHVLFTARVMQAHVRGQRKGRTKRQAWFAPLGAATLVGLVVLGAAQLGDNPTPPVAEGPSSESTNASVLLVSESEVGSEKPRVQIDGTLGVSAAGCITVGDKVLFAPYGSRLESNGRQVLIAGIGRFALGEDVTFMGSEGSIRDAGVDTPETVKQCMGGAQSLSVVIPRPAER